MEARRRFWAARPVLASQQYRGPQDREVVFHTVNEALERAGLGRLPWGTLFAVLSEPEPPDEAEQWRAVRSREDEAVARYLRYHADHPQASSPDAVRVDPSVWAEMEAERRRDPVSHSG